jgi:membrane-associated protease RseP (regulator of RpoE activity)
VFAFRLGRIPVRVHLFFFLTALMLAGGRPGPLLVSWIVIVFVSVLIHELGHALVGRAFGLTPEIDLHGFGGTTSWGGASRLRPGPHILISLAGPLAGILFGGAIWLGAARQHLTPLASEVVGQIIWVNVGWGIFNLFPMLPLDGGNVLARVLDIVTGGRGRRPAHAISAAIALFIVLWVLARGGLISILKGDIWAAWPALLGTLFFVQNLRPLLPAPKDPPNV